MESLDAARRGNTYDMAMQVLNIKSNQDILKLKQKDLFEYYAISLKKHTSSEFKNSLMVSAKLIDDSYAMGLYQRDVEKLKNNNGDSFVIFPISSWGHLYGGVIRRFDNNFRVTIINKDERKSSNRFIGFVIPVDNIDKLWGFLEKNKNKTYTSHLVEDITTISTQFIKLNIHSRRQKVGNCFIKELETSIRFAMATRKYSEQDFDNLAMLKKSEKLNKDYPPIQMHRDFLDALINGEPMLARRLERDFDVYSRNKHFRDLVKSGKKPAVSLLLAFAYNREPQNKLPEEMSDNEIVKHLLREINMDTLMQCFKELKILAKNTKDPDLFKTLTSAKWYLTINKNFDSDKNLYEIVDLLASIVYIKPKLAEGFEKTLHNAKTYFPYVAKQLEREHHIPIKDEVLIQPKNEISRTGLEISKR